MLKMKTKTVSKPIVKMGLRFKGMNRAEAKNLGIPMPPHTDIIVSKDVPKNERQQIINHEYEEMKLLKKGEPYYQAHVGALLRSKKDDSYYG